MYDDILIPAPDQPISSSQFGIRVRDSILDLNRRVQLIESTMSNYAFKLANTTRANTTTATSDPDLQMWLEANSGYFVEFFMNVGAIPAEDIKTQWAVPSGTTTTTRRVLGPGSTAANSDADNISGRFGTHQYGTGIQYNGVRSANNLFFQVQEVAVVRTGGTAGYVAMQWAQVTSGATGTVVAADSFCRATKFV